MSRNVVASGCLSFSVCNHENLYPEDSKALLKCFHCDNEPMCGNRFLCMFVGVIRNEYTANTFSNYF